jgi:hypothetical protein
MPRDAAELARLLAVSADRLVMELLPHGRREGAEWRVGSLAGEAGRSCAVHLHGSRAGVWSDFASGEGGDALDLVAAVLFRGDRRQAMDWARSWLGLSDTACPSAQRRSPPVPAKPAVDPEAKARSAAALALFLAASPTLAGTPAALYLAARGLDLAQLGRHPKSLRFHPKLWNAESQRSWPALVAAITDAAGAHVATHRTWLAQTGDRWGKAPLVDAKMTLGRYAGGSIRIWRGASALPLARAPAGETVVIAEGIETALSVAIACPELRVLAAVSLANMARLELPAAIGTVILAADNDADNDKARAGLQRAVDRFAGEGRSVRLAMPDTPGADWNDVLIEKCA